MSSRNIDTSGISDEVADVITNEDEIDYEANPDFRLIDSYSLSSFADVDILEYIPEGTMIYWIDEPYLDEDIERITRKVISDVEEYLRQVETQKMSEEEVRGEIRSKALEFISAHESRADAGFIRYFLSEERRESISGYMESIGDQAEEEENRDVSDKKEDMVYHIERELLDFGQLTPIVNDKYVEDISCNGPDLPVYIYHNKHGNIATNLSYPADELRQVVLELSQRADKHISVANPTVSGRTEEGYRIQLTLSDEVSPKGSNFTIRKYKEEPFTPVDLIQFNTFSIEQMVYLWLAIENRKSLIFAGGTAAGKTTSMNAISMFIPPGSKIVTIEDTQEISLQHSNWVQSVTRDSFGQMDEGEIDMYQLLRDALRQRPEYIVVGEIRGEEAQTLFQAMNTGHTTYSTMHADSVRAAIDRLKNEPINVSKQLINALDIVSVQVRKTVDGDIRRRCKEMVEVQGTQHSNKNNIAAKPIFEYQNDNDEISKVSTSSVLEDIRIENNWTEEELEQEMNDRKLILQSMAEDEKQYEYREVANVFRTYNRSPEKVVERFKS
jgi:flagellar protein FlaI